MKALLEAAGFLSSARRTMRYGSFSREPLLLLRVEWKGDSVACDWLIRSADPWDKYLPAHLAEEHQTLQALRDAMSLRDIIFKSFPAVITADLRMFRADGEHHLQLMMVGSVSRSNEIMRRVASVAMQAKLCGFHFTLRDGSLGSMVPVSFGCS